MGMEFQRVGRGVGMAAVSGFGGLMMVRTFVAIFRMTKFHRVLEHGMSHVAAHKKQERNGPKQLNVTPEKMHRDHLLPKDRVVNPTNQKEYDHAIGLP